MSWADGNYVETRFVKGMNSSVEPHTLDRDTGELPDIMNMVVRTQGLRTRHGWRLVEGLELDLDASPAPSKTPTAVFIYETAPILPKPEEDEGEEEGGGSEDDNTTGGGGVLIDGGYQTHFGGGGGGGGGGDDDPPEPPPVDGRWSMSTSGTIYPYVPYSVTLTYTAAQQQGGQSGNQQVPARPVSPTYFVAYKQPGNGMAAFSTLGTSGNNPWTKTILLMNLDRDIQSIKFRGGSLVGGVAEGTANYGLYSFVPNIEPSTVKQGVWFPFTIKVQAGGVLTGYRGNGRGMRYRLVGLDDNNTEYGINASTRGATWSNGVLSGEARIPFDIAPEITKIGLETEFLGETKIDIATLGESTGVEIEAPAELHIYGGAKEMSIAVAGEELPVVTLSFNGLGTCELVDEFGESLDFEDELSWNDGLWSNNVMAESSYGGIMTVTVTLGDETKQALIEIDEALAATVACASSGTAGVALPVSIQVTDGDGGGLTRFVGSAVGVAILDDDDQDVTEDVSGATFDSGWTSGGDWGGSLTFSESGTYFIKVYQAKDGSPLFSKEIEITAVTSSALAEAINERNLAKGVTTSYTGDEGASVLRTAAIEACEGYVNGDGVSASGEATLYDGSEEGAIDIDAAEETQAWYEGAYAKVCTAVCRLGGASMEIRERYASGFYQYETQWDEEQGQYIESGTEGGAKAEATQRFNQNENVGNWEGSSSYGAYQSGWAWKDYEAWGASTGSDIYDYRVKASGVSPFSRNADYYFTATKDEYWVYNNLGHHSLGQNGTGKLASSSADAGGEFGWDTHTFSLSAYFGDRRGYRLALSKCYITYGFKHK